MATSYLNQSSLPRGIRNNNPGNLKIAPISWQGKIPVAQNTDGTFEQFNELRYGIRAMIMDVTSDVRKGQNTIRKLITEYAPESDSNLTTTYINFVSQKTGIAPDTIISPTTDTMRKIVKAQIQLENGETVANRYITDAEIQSAFDVLPAGYMLPGIVTAAVSSAAETLSNNKSISGLTLFSLIGLGTIAYFKRKKYKNK